MGTYVLVGIMTYPKYLRERARQLRVEKKLTLDEIAERLALPKTTVFYWIRDLPLGKPRRENGRVGNLAMQEKYRLLREQAYAQGFPSTTSWCCGRRSGTSWSST